MIARPLAALAAAVALAFPTPSIAAESATVGASATKLLADAMSFLADSQAEDGSWSSFAGSGVTSLVGTGLLRNGSSAQDPVVAKALEYVLSHVKPTGAIHLEGTNYRNYETCLAIMFLTEANVGGRYDEVLANAEAFINDLQWDESEDQGPESLSYGGAGYGRHGRPDMSNTGFFLEAKQSLGRGEEDPAVRKALAFISRCQNLETEYNT
ncbi:MAG: prenyltransferase/squalene oxidase repeat-containing protein, partial [Planctomycetota bacterium]